MPEVGKLPQNTPIPSWRREWDPETVKKNEQWTKEGLWDLSLGEIWWRDHQVFLQERGYLLRPRLRPGWTPSWLGTNLKPLFCEDSVAATDTNVIDAVRIADGSFVAIKRVRARSAELRILHYLADPSRAQDPANHCAPVFDELSVDDNPDEALIVMPLLRPYDDPPFTAVGEVVECVAQTLQGLEFLHRCGVAHRDCSIRNIMMDASLLYPEGFHPLLTHRDLSNTRDAKHYRRIDTENTKYLFIDFGISVLIEEGQPRLAFGSQGQDQEPPELDYTERYDPFALDIFILGNLYRKTFLKDFSNLEFLRPLVESMTQTDPKARPTITEALARFKTIAATKQGLGLRWRLRSRDESQTSPTGRVFRQSTGAQRKKA